MNAAVGARDGARRVVAHPLVLLACVAVVFLGLGLRQAWLDAPTQDEPVYLTAGVTSLVFHDLRLNPEHPPLAKALAALPVLLARPIVPRGPAWEAGDEYTYPATFVAAQHGADALRREMFLARIVPLLEAVAVGFVLYALASRLFGRVAGLVAGLLWLVDPVTLGLGHLDGIDLPFTLATVLVSWALLVALRRPGHRELVVLGAACAGAVLVKDTGFIVAVTAALALGVAGWRRDRWRGTARVVPVALVAWLLVWACYLAIAPASSWHAGVLPAPYVRGLHVLVSVDTAPGPAYILGIHWLGRRWWFWPASLLVKVPLLTLAVLLAGPLALRRADRRSRREALAVAVLPATAVAVFTVWVPRDLGVRYLLPVLALWIVVASAVVLVPARRTIAAALAVVVLAAAVVTALSVPDSLSWVDPVVGHPYQVASDANVDWGQDYYRLQAWSAGRDAWVEYDGPIGVDSAPIPGTRAMPVTRPDGVTGWVAISATALTTSYYRSAWAYLRAYCPVGTVGRSIVVYRFASPPRAGIGPDRPAAPCAGASYSRQVAPLTPPAQR